MESVLYAYQRKKKINYALVRKNVKSNHQKKIKNAFSSNVQANRIKNFKNINFNSLNVKTKNKKNIKIKKTYFKKNLIINSFLYAFISHFAVSLFLNIKEWNLTNLVSYYYFKSEHLISTSAFIVSLFYIYYKILRGKPERDCPSCGAYAGSIIYKSRKKDYFGYQHQTKSGNPDKRYRYNPKLYSLITNWSCRYCNANFEFLHKLSKKPNKRTPIISVNIK